jgi:hypothetical protein
MRWRLRRRMTKMNGTRVCCGVLAGHVGLLRNRIRLILLREREEGGRRLRIMPVPKLEKKHKDNSNQTRKSADVPLFQGMLPRQRAIKRAKSANQSWRRDQKPRERGEAHGNSP